MFSAVGLIGGHAVDYEAMVAIAGPLVVGAESFENDERLAQFTAVLQRAIECEVVVQATAGDHPVENVGAVWLK